MFDDSSTRGKGLSLDLVGVLVVTFVVWGFVLFGAAHNPLQLLLGILFVVFLPGYALVALLFPSRSNGSHGLSRIRSRRELPQTITLMERIVLSVGMSVILVPFLGIVAHFAGWGLAAETLVALIGGLTAMLSIAAIAMRFQLPPDQRFGIGSFGPVRRLRAWILIPNDRRDLALNLFIVVGIGLAVVGVGAAAVMTSNGEQYTEFYLLGADEDAEDRIADGYPDELTVGESGTVEVGVVNREGGTRTYTVVEQIQRVDDTGERTEVVEREETDRFELTVSHGETVEETATVEPRIRGDDVRIVYLLYVDEPPEVPDVDSAYRTTHVWIDTSGSGA